MSCKDQCADDKNQNYAKAVNGSSVDVRKAATISGNQSGKSVQSVKSHTR